MKPVVFVVMPFGKKKNPITGCEFDFDKFYFDIFEPLANDTELDLQFVREDLVDTNGIIHRTMIEKLLLAEYVIADLSFSNPNVYYELGIRHCAKKQTTFIIFSDKLQFDVAPLRAIPYKLENNYLTEENAKNLTSILKEKLHKAKTTLDVDSPVFELIPDLDLTIDISESATKSFKERAIKLNEFVSEIKHLVGNCNSTNINSAILELALIKNSVGTCTETNFYVWCELIRAYKDLEKYQEVVETIKEIPNNLAEKSEFIQQTLGFSLNRLKEHNKAIQILSDCLDKFGRNSETYGLLGRVYKDLYNETSISNELQKNSYLDKAIDVYYTGFVLDSRNFYTGINVANLLFQKNDSNSIEKMNRILSVVAFSIGNIPDVQKDYWLYATHINCLLLMDDSKNAILQLSNLLYHNVPCWMFKTTRNDFIKIKSIYEKNALNTDLIDKIIDALNQKIEELELNKAKT